MLNFSANVGEIEQHLSSLEFNVIAQIGWWNWLWMSTDVRHQQILSISLETNIWKSSKKFISAAREWTKKSFDVKTFHFSVHYNNEVKQNFLHFIMNLKGSHIWRHVFVMMLHICDLLLSPNKRHKTVCVVINERSLFK